MDRLLSFPGGTIPASAVKWRFNPSGGPGGQHANRSNTRVEAEIDITCAGSIDLKVRRLLISRLGSQLRVVVADTRSQARNREIALDRLEQKLRESVVTTKPRKRTRPSVAARRRRLDNKRRRSETKRSRGPINPSNF